MKVVLNLLCVFLLGITITYGEIIGNKDFVVTCFSLPTKRRCKKFAHNLLVANFDCPTQRNLRKKIALHFELKDNGFATISKENVSF